MRILAQWCTPVAIFGAFLITIFGAYSVTDYTETAIGLRSYYYIPKDEISKYESNIQSGDLIAITTSIPNLDIVHVGFALAREGRIHLLHASTTSMEVEVSQKPLHDYLSGNKSQSGIMVGRLEDK